MSIHFVLLLSFIIKIIFDKIGKMNNHNSIARLCGCGSINVPSFLSTTSCSVFFSCFLIGNFNYSLLKFPTDNLLSVYHISVHKFYVIRMKCSCLIALELFLVDFNQMRHSYTSV